MVGTPAYMSPEQVTGGHIDRRTDIFSAGIILYQLLTGVRPFKGAGAWTVAKMIVHDDPPPPSTIADTAPPVFDEIVNQALAKNPADRFSNARDFAAALRRGLEDLDHQNDAQTTRPASDRPEQSRSQSGTQTSDAELAFWRSIQDSNDPAELELYLREFPSGTYAQLVQYKIAKLGGIQHAAKVTDEAAVKAKYEAEQKKREAEERVKLEADALLRGQQTQVGRAPIAEPSRDETVVEPPTIVALAQPQRKRAAIIFTVILAVLGGGTYLHFWTSNAPAPRSVETDKAKNPLVDPTTEQQERRAVGKTAQDKAASEKAHREYWSLRK